MAFHVAVDAHIELFYKLGYVGGMVQKANEYRGLGAPFGVIVVYLLYESHILFVYFLNENAFDI